MGQILSGYVFQFLSLVNGSSDLKEASKTCWKKMSSSVMKWILHLKLSRNMLFQ